MDSLSGSKLSGVQRDELMDQVKQQIAVANAQELLQKCISMCMDRYMDAWNVVSRAYGSRIQRERSSM